MASRMVMAIGILDCAHNLFPAYATRQLTPTLPGLMVAAEERRATSTAEAGVTRCRC